MNLKGRRVSLLSSSFCHQNHLVCFAIATLPYLVVMPYPLSLLLYKSSKRMLRVCRTKYIYVHSRNGFHVSTQFRNCSTAVQVHTSKAIFQDILGQNECILSLSLLLPSLFFPLPPSTNGSSPSY